ncbi:MAG: bifunctional folylpolyglutamate synthase/dihydrofolate synthase [Chloroflexi bacterium]|nr:bifunctional folylpolyglutamate synthase/dihydrofolate synthase [Chloroflexota bacterium]
MPRTRALLDLAGAPDRDMACVLVAGTKGKGSTATFLASALDAAGIRAGLYTSPHLQGWRERIRVRGVAIRPDAFGRAVDNALRLMPRLRRAHPDLGEPTAFELLTVAALAHFARSRCAVAVLEVGLGGRFDATNAVDPAISVITSIGLDHEEILGPGLGRIAREKAGVLRTDRAALVARQLPAAATAIRFECRRSQARCVIVGPLPRGARLGLAGDHQRQNAALAAAAAVALSEVGIQARARAIARGLAAASLPGRFEDVGGIPPVVLDGAHTAEATAALARTLRQRFPRARAHLIFGCTADRDPAALARPLRGARHSFYATAAPGPRAMPPEAVATALGPGTPAFVDVAAAIVAARRAAGPGDVVCVTGSLALVGAARDALGLPIAERLWSASAGR